VLGWRFEELAAILDGLNGSPRVGVCLDTCHVIASGYDIASSDGYAKTMADFDRVIGLGRLRVIHGNDSKRPCGSRIDRHEHVGEGCLGTATFRRLFQDRRLDGLPILIETEKTSRSERPASIAVDPLDARNLATLKRLRDG
jgi:deoxyribonuclease-4